MTQEKQNNKFEGLYIIGYGLSGGFGGIRTYEVIEDDSLELAEKQSFEQACEEYDRYAGSNGLREVGEIMEEEQIEDENEACGIFEQERESWLDYVAKPYSKEFEKEISGHHYHNPFKHITDI